MTTLISKAKCGFGRIAQRFHNDQRGMEALQIVVILAVAALVMLMLNVWVGTANDGADANTIGGWVRGQLDSVFALDFAGGIDPDLIELEE